MDDTQRQHELPDLHKLMNYLTSIIGNAQLLGRKLDRGDGVSPVLIREMLRAVEQAGWKANREVLAIRKVLENNRS